MQKGSQDFLVVQTALGLKEFKCVAPRILSMRQVVTAPAPVEQLVAYGQGWCVFFFDKAFGGQVQIFRDGIWQVSPEANIALIPPFSLVHWRFLSTPVEYQMYYWLDDYLKDLPEVATAMAIPHPIAGNPQAVLALSKKPTASWPIDRISHSTKLATEVHKIVIGCYWDDKSLGHHFKKNGLSPVAACRAFTSIAGIPPGRYRTLLRMMRALELLLIEHASVTEAGFDLGFSELSQFYRQFKSYAGATPGRYAAKRRLR